MPTSWWYIFDGSQHGPVTSDDLQDRIRQQQLSADTLVWRTEFADWRRIADIPELLQQLPAYQQVNTPTSPEAWWYVQDGGSVGPVTQQALERLLQQGQLSATSLVWHSALAGWVSAAEAPGLNASPALEAPASLSNKVVLPPALHVAAPASAPSVAAEFRLAGPWRRFFARQIDIYLLSIPLAFILAFVLSSFFHPFALWIQKPGAASLYLWLLLPFVMLLEALIYAVFGNTVGKMLLGIRVTYDGFESLASQDYLKRQLRVYWYGLGTGFPLIQLIAVIRQYFHHKAHGHTRYDAGRCILVHSEHGRLRTALSPVLLILLLIALIILNFPL